MRSILNFIKRLVSAMVKGFVFTGIAAAIPCAVVLFVMEPGHQVTLDTSAAFALVIALLAGMLGAAVALIYHLSHLDGIHHAVQHMSELRAAQREQARIS
jgi:putative exporter of polyketide antibiotics